jgi:predicted chitinase
MANSMTRNEFNNAFTSCGFQRPSEDHYKHVKNLAIPEIISSKRELAMFLAQIMHESGGLVYIREQNLDHLDSYGRSAKYPKNDYYGRGYIQLTQ